MAKYRVECPVCECAYMVQLTGPHKNRYWRLENADWTCDACKEKERQEENREAAEANTRAGLPGLSGSEKQIAWAETIRKQKIATLDENLLKRTLNSDVVDVDRFWAAVEVLKNKSAATWWIDNRDIHIDRLMKIEYDRIEKPLSPQEKQTAEKAKAEAMKEATVRPVKLVTETVAEISTGGEFVEVSFPEKREDFRQIVRFKLGYAWNTEKAVWRRDLKITNGTPHDRAAELGNRLLASGFPIRIYDKMLRVHAVYGTYNPESKRWIAARISGKYEGWFAVSWPREEDFYTAAKRLRGSRYDKPSIVVPAEQFQEIIDFAKMYQFSISDGAQKLIDIARSIRESAFTASVKTKEDRRLPEPGDKPAPLAVPDNVEIDNEFKEGI